jgi:hypothetical protein
MSTIYEDSFQCILFDGSVYTLLRGYHYEKQYALLSAAMADVEEYRDSFFSF